MGAVLKGRDRDLGRDLAVKVLLEEHRDRPELVRRFVEEARIGGQLQHPGIVPVHELGTLGDCRPYFTMKLVEGRTLASLLDERRSAAEDRPRLLGIFEQVCQTMAYAHSRGVIHCDLKPSNVMVGSFGEVQVMDWGLAKVLERGRATVETRAGSAGPVESIRGGSGQDAHGRPVVLGTPAYMAPEQARGEMRRLDERTDVFGLGAILCEVLTGQPPFVGRGLAELQGLAVRADLADARERLEASGAEPELVALARRCLAPSPARPSPRCRRGRLGDHRLSPRGSGAAEAGRAGQGRGPGEGGRGEDAATAGRGAGGGDRRPGADRRRRRGLAGVGPRTPCRPARPGRARRRAAQAPGRTAGDDPARWAAAREAAHRAEQLATTPATTRRGPASPSWRRRSARRPRRPRPTPGCSSGSPEIRDASDETAFSQTDADYSEAFRSAGFDLNRQPPEEAGRSIARRPARVALALATALDHWAALRHKHGGRALADRLTAAARAADPDPWRGDSAPP